MAAIGERLKTVRETLGMSQGPFATALGVSINTISNWEREIAYPPADKLALIRQRHGIDINWLLTGEGTMTTADSSSTSSTKPRSIDSKALQMIIQTVEERATQAGITLGAAKKARLIVLLWEYSVETGKGIEPEMVDKYLELAV